MPVQSPLELTRRQILAYRRRVGHLDERLPAGPESLRQAAWAGLQDSMPRAAVLSLHARVEAVESMTWDDPSLAQLWGPGTTPTSSPRPTSRCSRSGACPATPKGRHRAETMAELQHARLAGTRMLHREAALGLDINPTAFKYAAPIVVQWDG